jgi:hypothetical protein
MQSLTDAANFPCRWLSQIKPWNGQGTFKDHLVQHYALMAMNKGTIDHARYMTRQLEKEWAGLGILIAKRIKELQNGN